MRVVPEIPPMAMAITPPGGPGAGAPAGPRRALAGFFVSGILLGFLGAILPSWGHHLEPDYWMVGLYFVALILGVLASVRLARPLMEKLGLGHTLSWRALWRPWHCSIWRSSHRPMLPGGGCLPF